MLIQCTQKLLKKLKIKPEHVEYDEVETLFSWHAHLITLNRRQAVVFMNDSNRYVIVLYGLLAKDFKNLNTLFLEAIRVTFKNERIKDDVIDRFVQYSPTMKYTKTKNQSFVAQMNKSVESVRVCEDLLEAQEINQPALSLRASRFVVGDNYIKGNEELYKDLEGFSGEPVIQLKAVQLKVTLQLQQFHVWRRLVIPVDSSFRNLHEILQHAFGWQDYHLHEFYVYDNESNAQANMKWSWNHPAYHKEGKRPILNIVSDEEAFEYGDDNIAMKLDTELNLSEFMPKYNTIRYNYDFGDGWQHDVEFEELIINHDKNYPICIDGEGPTPPEDVGGEAGYLEFLKVIADKDHLDHQEMLQWGDMQRYRDFNVELVNIGLKYKI